MSDTDTLSHDECFLCGTKVDADSRSDEHVFPKWLLREANLWNETAYQLNGTLLPYRQCIIPCCSPCNSGPLAVLESEVQRAFGQGAAAVAQLEPARLSLWTAKIYYGNIRRSHSLLADRREPVRGPIVPAEAFPILSMLRFFLQRIRLGHNFAFDLDSTFVCQLHGYDEPARNFDWLAATVVGKPGNERFVPAFALRHNGVGVISVFGDGGAQKKFRRAAFAEFADVKLHPVQFVELACLAFYQHSLFTDRISHWSTLLEGGPMVTIAHFPSDGPLWNEWDVEEYGMYLFRHLKLRSYSGISNLSDVCPGGGVFTVLHWPDGTRRVAMGVELE